MRHDDDIAFQRAILANPTDTTLKLVYADWLQDRSDPRAEFVRLQVQLSPMIEREPTGGAAEWLSEAGGELDPEWIAFMTTLAQPFASITFESEPGRPFTETVGTRGRIVTFESQYQTANDWGDGLLADIAFLAITKWGGCHYGYDSPPIGGFLCDLGANVNSLADDDIRVALRVEPHRWDWITELFEDQFLFDHETAGAVMSGTHGRLKQYVDDGRLWYITLRIHEQLARLEDHHYRVGLAVGRSPHGNRLVGAFATRLFRDR